MRFLAIRPFCVDCAFFAARYDASNGSGLACTATVWMHLLLDPKRLQDVIVCKPVLYWSGAGVPFLHVEIVVFVGCV